MNDEFEYSLRVDSDGWWWLTCFTCSQDFGPFPGRNEADDELCDHVGAVHL